MAIKVILTDKLKPHEQLRVIMRFSFKEQMGIFVLISAVTFLAIYAMCGTLDRVQCHEIILGR